MDRIRRESGLLPVLICAYFSSRKVLFLFESERGRRKHQVSVTNPRGFRML